MLPGRGRRPGPRRLHGTRGHAGHSPVDGAVLPRRGRGPARPRLHRAPTAFLIQHGSADPVVDPNQSVLLHAALLAAGVPSTHVVLEGAGHGGPEFTSASNLALVEAFLDARVKAGR